MKSENILINPSEAELAAAVEENLFDLFRAMMALPGSEIDEGDQLSRHLAFPHNPMFKGVWRTRLAAAEADEAIDETLAWFKSRNAPFLFWWTGPGTTPDDLGERLMARGLLSMEGQMEALAKGIKQTALGAPGMVADLQDMNEAALKQVPPGFTIEAVQDEAALEDFKRVFVESYEIPEWAGQAWVDATRQLGIGRTPLKIDIPESKSAAFELWSQKLRFWTPFSLPVSFQWNCPTPWKMYVGYLDGQPVATNMLFNGGGVASVYAVATMPSARGQGIGGAITLKSLLEARDMGYRYAVLFATEMGVHAYQRIGFRLTEARINRYLWRNE